MLENFGILTWLMTGVSSDAWERRLSKLIVDTIENFVSLLMGVRPFSTIMN